jgi:Sulfotransferase domain
MRKYAPIAVAVRSVEKESRLSSYRFSRVVRLGRGIRAFLCLEAGTTRGKTPDERRIMQVEEFKAARQTIKKIRRELARKDQQREAQAQRLETARQTIKKTRRELARKDQQLDQRKARTGRNGDSNSRRNVESTIDVGALPDFLIIGTEKGGTTFLYYALCEHPYIEPATEKEVHFFDTRKWFDKGGGWYQSQFPGPAWKDGRRIITGEASPYYLFHPFVPRRISSILPGAKLIALLRNPVDRAYSAYIDKVSAGQEILSFEDALAEEENRTAGELEKMLADERYYSSNLRVYAYRARGIYVDQLQRWHEYFSPDQLLVLRSEDLFTDPVGTVQTVHKFLDLPKYDANVTLPEERRNSRMYSPMTPETRERLEQFFEPHNRRLYDYLGVDFHW